MKRADLLALADLMEMGDWDDIECDHDLAQFIDFVRQVAQASPDAWRADVRGTAPKTDWRRYGTYQSEVDAAIDLTVGPHDVECRVVPLYELSSLED